MLLKKTSLFLLFSALTQILSAQFPPETPWGIPQEHTEFSSPAYLESTIDPAYDTTITCITNIDVFRDFVDNPELTSGDMQHQYAKIQAWNADMSLIHMGRMFFLNGDDYTINKTIPYSTAALRDSRWSHIDPEIIFYGEGEDFNKINVLTEEIDVLHSFPGYEYVTIGPWEGNISADDRYVVITSHDDKKASIYDIENDEVLATKEMEGIGFDWVSFTPSGDYIVMMNRETDHTEIYDMDFNYVRDLVDEIQHADFAIDTNGDEVLVQMISLSMIRLSDGFITDLAPPTDDTSGTCGSGYYNPNIGGHISGRSFAIPGWALAAADANICSEGSEDYNWNSELFLIKLDGSGTVRHFGHARTSFYFTSRASISPDASKIIYSSDWGSGVFAEALDYIVEFNNTVSLDDLGIQNITIFPNPVKDILRLEADNIIILDMLGRSINTITPLDTNIIDVSKLNTGVYFVKGIDKTTKDPVMGRFIKE